MKEYREIKEAVNEIAQAKRFGMASLHSESDSSSSSNTSCEDSSDFDSYENMGAHVLPPSCQKVLPTHSELVSMLK